MYIYILIIIYIINRKLFNKIYTKHLDIFLLCLTQIVIFLNNFIFLKTHTALKYTFLIACYKYIYIKFYYTK